MSSISNVTHSEIIDASTATTLSYLLGHFVRCCRGFIQRTRVFRIFCVSQFIFETRKLTTILERRHSLERHQRQEAQQEGEAYDAQTDGSGTHRTFAWLQFNAETASMLIIVEVRFHFVAELMIANLTVAVRHSEEANGSWRIGQSGHILDEEWNVMGRAELSLVVAGLSLLEANQTRNAWLVKRTEGITAGTSFAKCSEE